MNAKHMSYIVALPLSLLAAGFAFGQTTPQTQQHPTTQQRAQQSRPYQSTNGSSQTFSRLAGQKGYVTRSEAAQDPWLQRHFQQCDDNHDNKVNRAEFRQCRQQFTRNSGMQSRQSSQYGNTQQQEQQSGQQAMGNRSSSKFNQLAGGKGYVTQSQVAGDPWLQQHFQQCDSNGDGQLSRAEYQACQRR